MTSRRPIPFLLFSFSHLLLFVFLSACSTPTQSLQTSTDPPPVSPSLIEATQTQPPTLEDRATPVPQDTPLPGATNTSVPTQPPIPTPTPTPFVFAVIGDYGEAGSHEADVAELIKSWNPEIILTTGDNNYPIGQASTIDANIGQYYHDYIAPYTGSYGPGADVNRFFPVPGNHDWETPNILPYLDYFTLPGNERYYDFTWGPVHFFALNSDSREPDGVGQTSVQAQWFQQTLAASNAPWKIAYMHHAPYSSSYHSSTTWAQWPYAAWGVDAVLAGHDHVYERLEVDGIPYFTNGLGGSSYVYWFANILPESKVRYRDRRGAMRVTATDTTLTFEFITVEGELIDTWTLTQSPTVETPTPSEAIPPTDVTAFPEAAAFKWTPIASGYNSPILLTHAGDGSGRLFVVEQPGLIRLVGQEIPFLDIRSRVGDEANEQGLLGLAFHPQYKENGYFYVNYTDNNGDTIVARYEVSSSDPNQANNSNETILLHIRQPFRNHNGGHLAFGPDGYLYIATGDGGSAGDPEGNAQNSFTLLGKLLRIDINTSPYSSPLDNPFIVGDGLGEIWVYGLRNPWRFSFDRLTGDLYIGDVGQSTWEEINFLEAGTPGGVNFGWDYFEGTHVYEGNAPAGLSLTAPIWEYSHVGSVCSVTGGYVYRAPALPEWFGVYLYGDFCSGQVWGLLRDANGVWQNTLLFETGVLITSFGEDEAGEVYLVARQGDIYKLVRR